MKKFIATSFLLITLYFICNYYQNIIQFIMINIVYKDDIIVQEANSYEKNNNWGYVQLTDDFTPHNKQDILNIFYTALNKGWDELTFYCPTDYKNCTEDVNNIALNSNTLSYINNFVATYNSYNKIYVNINNFGRVNIQINKIYDKESINAINLKIDEAIKQYINDDMTDEEKIKALHDFIVNGTIYDNERSEQIKNGTLTDEIHPSNTALGPLYYGKAICGGYTDLMALFLDKLGIKNYKVSSKNHIWNVVYLNGNWKHLDLTWDDPVVNTGENIVTYNYFLISTDELKTKDDNQHNYDESIFVELK